MVLFSGIPGPQPLIPKFYVKSISPSTITADGQAYEIFIHGAGFKGTSTVAVSGTGITVSSVRFESNYLLAATLVAAIGASLTSRTITVTRGLNQKSLEDALTVVAPSVLEYVRIQLPTVLELATQQGQAIDWTPTLLVGDGTGTWTADNLPTGASIDSGTGQITGTLSTLGKWDCLLTYTEGPVNDRIPVSFHVYDQVDTTTFTAGNKSAAINPPASNRMYVVQGNITADNTAVSFAGRSNVLLNLNGYSITYDYGTTSFDVPNGNFASGTDDWDITGVTGFTNTNTATLASGRAPDNGANALHSTVAGSGTETLVSDSNFSLVNNVWYAVTFWWTNTTVGDHFNFALTLGSHSSAVTGSFIKAGGWRPGTCAVWKFKATATESVPLQISWTNNTGTAKEINISNINIDQAYVHGLVNNLDAAAPYATGSGTGSKISVCNGSIIQGKYSVGSAASRLWGNITLDEVSFSTQNRVCEVNGGCITTLPRGLIMNGCTLAEHSRWSNNRDAGYGNVVRDFSSTSSLGIGYHYRENTITHGLLGGIAVSSSGPQTYATICKWNVVAMQGKYTNGFCILIKGFTGARAECSHNVINTTVGATDSGRGIRISGSYVDLHHNYVRVRSLPNIQEYGGCLLGGAYAMQAEAGTNQVYFRNEHYIVAGTCGGGVFRFNGTGATDTTVDDCTFEVACDGSTSQPASVFKFSEPVSGTIDLAEITVNNCVIKTNHRFFEFDTNPGNFSNALVIADSSWEIVNDSVYVDGNPWSNLPIAGVIISNPTYADSFTQTEIETKDASDSNVSIV